MWTPSLVRFSIIDSPTSGLACPRAAVGTAFGSLLGRVLGTKGGHRGGASPLPSLFPPALCRGCQGGTRLGLPWLPGRGSGGTGKGRVWVGAGGHRQK